MDKAGGVILVLAILFAIIILTIIGALFGEPVSYSTICMRSM